MVHLVKHHFIVIALLVLLGARYVTALPMLRPLPDIFEDLVDGFNEFVEDAYEPVVKAVSQWILQMRQRNAFRPHGTYVPHSRPYYPPGSSTEQEYFPVKDWMLKDSYGTLEKDIKLVDDDFVEMELSPDNYDDEHETAGDFYIKNIGHDVKLHEFVLELE